VLVTGGTSGIGLAVVRLFVAEGARVVLVGRRSELVAALAGELGDAAVGLVADVRDASAVRRVVEDAWSTLGGLDVVVASAGVCRPRRLEELDDAAWRETIETNLSGTFYVARDAGLRMRDGAGGTIITLGSELSVRGLAQYVDYCASKFGLIGLTKALAAELAPRVTVNAVCPGPVDTPMMDAELRCFPDPAAVRAAMLNAVPLRRFATAEEIAAAILFLAADAGFATGATLELDGGTTVG
jgi:NAD(P)-dependent dehydrogenase (short-subunit alcohol dehydrogenase family)